MMMKTIKYQSESRGSADHGWLQSRFSFSFAEYYNPERMNFGALRVINDDVIAAGKGFGTHPHQNMEIVTIPLSGALEHKDSMGNTSVIRTGDVQIMSAGTGVQHSEFNHSSDEPVTLLQIWVLPDKKNITPRYDQKSFALDKLDNRFLEIVSSTVNNESVWINQDASFYLGKFSKNNPVLHQIKSEDRGLYIFVIDGKIEVDGETLSKRDALGVWDGTEIKIEVKENSFLLMIEVPM
jgi:quercetin 2,3-dioxygenase